MIIGLFLISLVTRLLFLYFGFPSITHDEADYFINGYLMAKTGFDIYGRSFFLTSGILNPTSSIPIYLNSLIYFLFEKSVFSARLPFALINSITPVLFYLILNKLTKNKTLSIIGFVVFNFSPWFSYLSSQSAFDSPISLLFYLAAFYVLLIKIKPIYKNILFLLFSFLSFNSYMGIKISFPLLMFIALIGQSIVFKNKFNLKRIVNKFFVSLFLFITLFSFSYFSPGGDYFQSRLKEKLIPFNKNIIADKVNYERSITSKTTFIEKIFFNKITALTSLFLEKYIQAFNPYFLFVRGDQHVIYGTNYLGLFYIFDLLFLIAGFFTANKVLGKNSLIALIFFFLFIVSAIPIGISIDIPNISIRGYPLIIPYVFFISIGAYHLLKKSSSIIFLYLISFVFFFTLFQVSIKNASSIQWHQLEKSLSQKLSEVKQKNKNINKKIIVYVNEPKETLLLYLFYKENNPNLIKQSILSNNYSIENISFSSSCPQEKIKNSLQIIHSERCPIDTEVFKPSLFIEPINNLSPSYLILN